MDASAHAVRVAIQLARSIRLLFSCWKVTAFQQQVLLVSLRLESLDAMSMEQRLKQIGNEP
jgi:hypothetical protein